VLYIYTTYDLINKIKELDKKQKTVLLLLCAIIILFIGTRILKSSTKDNKNVWDYKKADSIESIRTVVSSANHIDDRIKYWELTTILDKYVATITENSSTSYKQFYNILTKEYKRKISKKEYNNLASEFLYGFVYQSNDDSDKYIMADYSIKDIYLYDEDMYLCYISVNIDNMSENDKSLYYKNDYQDIVVDRKTDGYIGIKLDRTNSTYSIFYIE